MFCLFGMRGFVVKDDWSGHGLDVKLGCKNTAWSNSEKGIEKGYLVVRVCCEGKGIWYACFDF